MIAVKYDHIIRKHTTIGVNSVKVVIVCRKCRIRGQHCGGKDP